MTPDRTVTIYFDGLCERDPETGRANPGGIACGGWWIPAVSVPGLEQGASGRRCYGRGAGMTNNVAEYEACLDGLRAVYTRAWRGAVIVRGDSQLVIKQASGEWGCGKPELAALLARVHTATGYFSTVTFTWIKREDNKRADVLSRAAYRDALRELRD
jgi:ribonuclease HI